MYRILSFTSRNRRAIDNLRECLILFKSKKNQSLSVEENKSSKKDSYLIDTMKQSSIMLRIRFICSNNRIPHFKDDTGL